MSGLQEKVGGAATPCPRCGRTFQDGFISGSTHPIRWYLETPPRSTFSGVSLFGFPVPSSPWGCFNRSWVTIPAMRCRGCRVVLFSYDHTGRDLRKRGKVLEAAVGVGIVAVFGALETLLLRLVGTIRYEEIPVGLIWWGVLAFLLGILMMAFGTFLALRGLLWWQAGKEDEQLGEL